jgi:hypothetical protein
MAQKGSMEDNVSRPANGRSNPGAHQRSRNGWLRRAMSLGHVGAKDRFPPRADLYSESNEGPVWGHEDEFPRPGPSDRCRFGEETFAGTSANGQDAPFPAVRG